MFYCCEVKVVTEPFVTPQSAKLFIFLFELAANCYNSCVSFTQVVQQQKCNSCTMKGYINILRLKWQWQSYIPWVSSAKSAILSAMGRLHSEQPALSVRLIASCSWMTFTLSSYQKYVFPFSMSTHIINIINLFIFYCLCCWTLCRLCTETHWPGIEPSTLLLWGVSANNCTDINLIKLVDAKK